MSFLIVKNGIQVVARVDSAGDARAELMRLVKESPAATFEACNVLRRVYSEVVPASRRVVEEQMDGRPE